MLCEFRRQTKVNCVSSIKSILNLNAVPTVRFAVAQVCYRQGSFFEFKIDWESFCINCIYSMSLANKINDFCWPIRNTIEVHHDFISGQISVFRSLPDAYNPDRVARIGVFVVSDRLRNNPLIIFIQRLWKESLSVVIYGLRTSFVSCEWFYQLVTIPFLAWCVFRPLPALKKSSFCKLFIRNGTCRRGKWWVWIWRTPKELWQSRKRSS